MRTMRQNQAFVNTRQAFLAALHSQLASGGSHQHAVASAACAAGVHRATPYRWRQRDAAFAAAWAALDDALMGLVEARYQIERRRRMEARAARLAELRPQFAAQAAAARAARSEQRRQRLIFLILRAQE